MASHGYLRAFCEYANGQLDLICSSSLKSEARDDIRCQNIYFVEERSRIERLMSIFTGYMNRYVSFTKELLSKHPNKYSLVVFDHSNIAGTLIDTVNSLKIKSVTIHHNYEKEYFSDNNHGFYKLFFLNHVIRWERKAYLKSDLNLFLTKQDLIKFQEVYGKGRGKCSVIGAFEYKNYTIPTTYPKINDTLTFVITGSLSNFQTTDAVSYFFSDLYSTLPTDCKIIVAGRNPSAKVIELCNVHNNVELIPNPQNMDEVVSRADIYICATRIGGGLKLRVMDGLKNGLPVITHICSARGFDAFVGEPVFKIFSTSGEFKKGVFELITLCKSGDFNKCLIQNIYKKHFSFESGLERVKKSLSLIYD